MAELAGIIAGNYLRDILDQPAALEGAVAALSSPVPLPPLPSRPVLLTGMGSSFHAFHPLQMELEEAGLPALLVETSELIHYRRALLDRNPVIVALSQSGRSVEILRLLELVGSESFLIGVTNDPESPLAQSADAAVLMAAGSESTVSTKTYLASLAVLGWVGDQLRGVDPSSSLSGLQQAPPSVSLYLSRWESHVREAQEEFEGINHLFLVGRGASLAATGTGGLITKESARFHAEGMSAAAFRHGPLEMVGPEVFVLVFEGDPRTAELNHRLSSDVKRAGGRSAVVRESDEAGLFRLPPAPARIRPILEILPVQMITLALAAIANREAGAFCRATKVTAVE